jgi:hypothetical protein
MLHGDHLHMWNTGEHKEWMVFLARTHAGAGEKKPAKAESSGSAKSGY